MDDVALVSTRSMSHKKLSLIVKPRGQPRWRLTGSVSFHRLANCEQFVDRVFQWLHLRHGGQRTPIYFLHWCKFRRDPVWRLGYIAGLDTSHRVDDVLAVDRAIFLRWLVWRVLEACCWVVPTKILFRHKFIAYHRHRVALQHFQFHETNRAITSMIKDVWIWSLHPAMVGQIWDLGVQLHHMFIGWQSKTSPFSFANMSIVALAEPPAHISIQTVA